MTTNRKKVIELSYYNVLIYNCLKYWKNGDCNWEEAMTLAVIQLAEDNERLYRQLSELYKKMPVTVPNDEQKKGDK